MRTHVITTLVIGFIVGSFLAAAGFTQYAIKAEQVGKLEIVTDYPSAFTAFFGDEPDVYVKNVGDTYSRFAFRGREVSLKPGEQLELEGIKPGDHIEIDVVMPILFGAHITGVTGKAPMKMEAESNQPPADGRHDVVESETALAVAE